MRTLGRTTRIDVAHGPVYPAARAKALAAALIGSVWAAARNIQLQYVSLVAGIGLAIAAVFWLSSAQDAAKPASKQAFASTAATSTRAEDHSHVVVYLVGSQADADVTWAMEREAEWIRYHSGVLQSRQVVMHLAETLAEQDAIRATYTGQDVIELGRDIVFFDLTER